MRKLEGNIASACIAVLLASFAARLLFFTWRGPQVSPDSADYLLLAHNLVHHLAFSLETGPPFGPSIRRPPLYPFFLALLNGGASPVVAVIVQATLDSLVAVLVLLMARSVVPAGFALVAGMFYAVHPGAIVQAASLLTETLFTFLLACAVAVLVLAVSKERPIYSGVAGACFGLAILCRPIAMLLPVVLIALMLTLRPLPNWRRHGLALAGCLCVAIAPWLVRGAWISGHFVFVQSYGAVSLYIATLYDLDQANEPALWPRLFGPGTTDPVGKMVRSARTPAAEVAADRLSLRLAMENIGADPGAYLRSRVRFYPVLLLSSFDKMTGVNQSFAAARAANAFAALSLKLSLLLLFSFLPLACAAAGVVWTRPQPAAVFCAGAWVYMLVIHLPFWVEYRLWVPAMPFLLVSAALGAYRLMRTFARDGG